ncbi:MAG: GreA/GreB family elongation factor [Gemmatimonadota bacterium]
MTPAGGTAYIERMFEAWRQKITREVTELDRELRVDLPREIRRAVELGDLRENAEYSAALERQAFVRARLSHLQRRLNEIGRLSARDIPRDRIALGSWVDLELEGGERMDIRLVLPEFVGEGNGLVSISSPIGRALLGRVAGDRVTIQLPDGPREASVRDFETIHTQESATPEPGGGGAAVGD